MTAAMSRGRRLGIPTVECDRGSVPDRIPDPKSLPSVRRENTDMLIVLLPLPPHAERLAARAAAASMPAPPPTAAVHAKERTLEMQNSRHTHMQNTEQL